MEENKKLARVMKMSKVTSVIMKVCEIICIVAVAIMLATGILCLTGAVDMKDAGSNDGKLLLTMQSGGAQLALMSLDESEIPDLSKWHSDIPFVQNWIDNGDMAPIIGLFVLTFSLYPAALFVVFFMTRKIFLTILKEQTPFSTAVVKQFRISLIVLSVLLLILSGSGTVGVVEILILWSIYLIFDYGFSLQEIVDDTI